MMDPLGDDTPPPEELEMAVEEATGKVYPGKPQERIEALNKRIAYLRGNIERYTNCAPDSLVALDKDTSGILDVLRRDLREAEKQLQEWQTQHEGRN